MIWAGPVGVGAALGLEGSARGWSGGGPVPGSPGREADRRRWTGRHSLPHCRMETHVDRREEARAPLWLGVYRPQTSEPMRLKLPLARAPQAPNTAPEAAVASQADPHLHPLCSGRSSKGPGPGEMCQQRGEVTACGLVRGREGLSTWPCYSLN